MIFIDRDGNAYKLNKDRLKRNIYRVSVVVIWVISLVVAFKFDNIF